MKYEAWTWKDVEARVLEAAATLRLMPGTGSAPTIGVDDFSDDDATVYSAKIEFPTAAQISRMEECWTWINRWLNEAQRKLLYAWSSAKVRKGRKISGISKEYGMNERFMRREITKYCSIIMNNLNCQSIPHVDNGDLRLSENEREHGQSHVTSNNCANEKRSNTWMSSDAKPIHDPESHELASLTSRLEEGNARREREARRREKLGMCAS